MGSEHTFVAQARKINSAGTDQAAIAWGPGLWDEHTSSVHKPLQTRLTNINPVTSERDLISFPR